MRVRQQAPNRGAYEDEWDSRVRCAWSDCDNPGSGLHYRIECFRSRALSDHSQTPRRMTCPDCRKSLFCSEQHASFWDMDMARGGLVGNLAPGLNGRYL